MAFYFAQHGTGTSLISSAGALTSVSLPTGVTISANRRPRFTIWGREVIMVNAATRPVAVNRAAGSRVLVPRPPASAPTLTATGSGTLSGTFQVAVTYVVRDQFGNLLAESDFGPLSVASATLTNQLLLASNIPISADTVTGRKLYRTVTGPGTVLFPWVELDGNTTTSVANDMSDLALGLVSAPELGNPPDLEIIAEFRDRLWGRDRYDLDTLRYTEVGAPYAWPVLNGILIPRVGSDTRGIVQVVSRKDSLGVGRQNSLHQVSGNSIRDFRRQLISEFVGFEAPEGVVAYKDSVFFLWKDGVYQWDAGQITCISDGKVRSWFTNDTEFNRARFPYAMMTVDPIKDKLLILLSAAGSTDLDRWVEYDLNDNTWWGPHKTGAFTPTCNTYIYDANELAIPIMGSSSGYLWKPTTTRTDDTATAIDFDVDTKWHDGNTPDIEKFFDMPSFLYKIQGSGTLTATPYVGSLAASAGTAISVDMTLGRARVRRLGTGRFVRWNLRQNTAAVDVELFGYEMPYHELGRR